MKTYFARMTYFFRPRRPQRLTSVAGMILALALWSASAQTPAPSAGRSSSTVALHDPTTPEVQAPLDVDRDPILSIDPEAPPPPVTASSANTNPKEAQRGQNGMYILHADVDEVVLSCTVIDDKGRTVQDLAQSDFQ